MTEPKKLKTEEQNFLEASDSEKTRPNHPTSDTPPRPTGFFNTIRQELCEEEPHPTEAVEIVIMDEGEGDK